MKSAEEKRPAFSTVEAKLKNFIPSCKRFSNKKKGRRGFPRGGLCVSLTSA